MGREGDQAPVRAGERRPHARIPRRLLGGLGVLLLVVLMLGSAAVGIAVWYGNRPVDDRTHSLEAFDEHPEQDPIERLGRWDGERFVPVAPGSVHAQEVTVLVHGLAQGAKGMVDAHRGPTPLLAWDAIGSDGRHQFGWLAQLARASEQDEPQRVVLAYSWIDDSAIGADILDAKYSQARTELNGHRLAQALKEALGPEFSIHAGLELVGHSHGARVATVAAASMSEPVAHLVLLDSPDNLKAQLGGATNNLAPVLRRLDLSRNGTFVDNYYSSFGVPYGDQPGLGSIVDVRLEPGHDFLEVAGHTYAHEWYKRSATRLNKSVGFAWSPLRFGERDFDPPKRGTDLEQDWLVTGESVSRRELALQRTAEHHGPEQVLQRAGLDAHDGDASVDDHDTVELAEDGDTRWTADFEVDDDDVAIELDYRFTDPGDGDQLGLWIDGELRMVTVGTWAGTDQQTVAIDVANLEAGHHNITLAVHAFGSGNAQVEATNFQKVATPGLNERTREIVAYVETGAAIVFIGSTAALIAVFGLFLRHRRRNRARLAEAAPSAGR